MNIPVLENAAERAARGNWMDISFLKELCFEYLGNESFLVGPAKGYLFPNSQKFLTIQADTNKAHKKQAGNPKSRAPDL